MNCCICFEISRNKLATLRLFHTYEADPEEKEVSMHKMINFVVNQTQMQAAHTWSGSNRHKHGQKGIQREK